MKKVDSKELQSYQPPFDYDSERMVIGALMYDAESLYEAKEYMERDDFFKNSHRILWDCIEEYIEEGMFNPQYGFQVDFVTLCDLLDKKGYLNKAVDAANLAEISDQYSFTSANISYHAKQVHELARRREYWRLAYKVFSSASNEKVEMRDLSDIMQEMFDIHHSALYGRTLNIIEINNAYHYEEKPVLIEMDGSHLLTEGNMMGVVAGIGAGKSHLMEMFASLWVRDDCEPEGNIEMNHVEDSVCLMVDTERDTDLAFKGFERIQKRVLNGGGHGDLISGKGIKGFRFVSLRHVYSIAEKRTAIVKLLRETENVKLLIVDGITDFVNNENDIEQAGFVTDWLFNLADEYKMGVLFTIHGNRNDSTGKGKGWLGARMQQRSATFMRLKSDESDPSVKILTTDFENKKVRLGRDTELETALKWCDDLHMFRCIQWDSNRSLSRDEILHFIFAATEYKGIGYKTLTEQYSEKAQRAEPTAKKHIKSAVTAGTLRKVDKLYFWNGQTGDTF